VADFCEELYLKNRTAVHVFVDEADLYAPQRLEKSSRHHGRCLAAVDNLVRRGRFRGIGDTLISQRPAVVNKNVLSQVGSMFFLQMLAPQDLDAVGTWLHANIRGEAREACRADLPLLGQGICYFMRGGDRPMFRKFSVRTKTTFDSSRTPKFNEVAVVPELRSLSDEERAALDACYGSELSRLQVAEEVSPAAGGGEGDAQELAASIGVQHGDDGDDPSARLSEGEVEELRSRVSSVAVEAGGPCPDDVLADALADRDAASDESWDEVDEQGGRRGLPDDDFPEDDDER
jgi:hypothetical protein